jgi:hypothetical protein
MQDVYPCEVTKQLVEDWHAEQADAFSLRVEVVPPTIIAKRIRAQPKDSGFARASTFIQSSLSSLILMLNSR